jgi:hypothetical protein
METCYQLSLFLTKKSIGFLSPGYRPHYGIRCLSIRPAKRKKVSTYEKKRKMKTEGKRGKPD